MALDDGFWLWLTVTAICIAVVFLTLLIAGRW
jgi:hypothetical protein